MEYLERVEGLILSSERVLVMPVLQSARAVHEVFSSPERLSAATLKNKLDAYKGKLREADGSLAELRVGPGDADELQRLVQKGQAPLIDCFDRVLTIYRELESTSHRRASELFAIESVYALEKLLGISLFTGETVPR